MKRLHAWALAMSATCCALAGGAFASDFEKDLIREFNAAPRAVRAEHPLLPLEHVGAEPRGGSYYVSRHLAALARARRTFTLRDVSEKKGRCELRFEAQAADRKTRISLIVAADDSANVADLMPLVLADLFEFRAPVHAHRFVGCKTGERRLHLAGCNHSPPENESVPFDTPEEAERQGFRRCAICFSLQPMPPVDNYPLVRAEALMQARRYELVHPPIADAGLQASVQALGDSLVACLPFEPRGFDYRFRVVQMEFPTAFSFSTGFVYVSDVLVNSLDSRLELAFILGHEIAHVEMHFPWDPAPEGKGDYAQWAKKHRQAESEADLVAQASLWKFGVPVTASKRLAVSLRKMEYFESEAAPQDKPGEFDLYPSDAERCAAIETPAYSFPAARGCNVDRDGNVLLRGSVIAAYKTRDAVAILVSIEGAVALSRRIKLTGVEVRFADGGKTSFEIDGDDEIRPEGHRLVRALYNTSGWEKSWPKLAALRDGRLRIFATNTSMISPDSQLDLTSEECVAE